MGIKSKLFVGTIMHKRLFPKENYFKYSTFYLFLNLAELKAKFLDKLIKINKFGWFSFYPKDLGPLDNTDLAIWANKILAESKIPTTHTDIILVTMPRVLGYQFNPVSFWLGIGKENELNWVVSEVHNTFGEQHCYVCHCPNQTKIPKDNWILADKVFHVSPFLERTGFYKFKFILSDNTLNIFINYFNNNKLQLVTHLSGNLIDLNKQNLKKVALKHPHITLKTIFLIHWQALKLLLKGIKHISKPKQLANKITSSFKSESSSDSNISQDK